MIIHQIGPTNKNEWHPLWKACQATWIKDEFSSYVLWNDQDDLEYLIKHAYSEYYDMFMEFPFHIMRIDFARLAILHFCGGLYVDLDVYCYKYDKVVSTFNLDDPGIYCVENITDDFTTAKFENCLFGSTHIFHPFFLFNMGFIKHIFNQRKHEFVINKNNKFFRDNDINSYLINNITGSGMLAHILEHYPKQDELQLHAFNADLYNFKPAAYNEKLIARHLHTDVWGENYRTNFESDKKLLIDTLTGKLFNVPVSETEKLLSNNRFIIMNYDEFDFFKNYIRK